MADKQDNKSVTPRLTNEWTDVLSPKIINQYVGSHIAIVHKAVVASAESYEAVVEEALRLFPDETPYIAFIATPMSDITRRKRSEDTPETAPKSPELG